MGRAREAARGALAGGGQARAESWSGSGIGLPAPGPWRCPSPTSAVPTAAAPASSQPRGRGGPSTLPPTPRTLPGGHWPTRPRAAVSDPPGDAGDGEEVQEGVGGPAGSGRAPGPGAGGTASVRPVSKAWGGVREPSAAPGLSEPCHHSPACPHPLWATAPPRRPPPTSQGVLRAGSPFPSAIAKHGFVNSV